MVRTEISLFLKNVPGELGRLASLLSDAGVNIDALTIQDASAYVRELFQARGKSLKRIASAASYNSMRKDSVDFALIRFLVDQTDKTIDLLSKNDYLFDILPVIAVELENRPGELARMSLGKFYVDELYDRVVVKPLFVLAEVAFWVVDRALVDFVMVNGAGRATRGFGKLFRRLQTGRVPSYAVWFLCGVVAILALSLWILK